jgi:DNA replication protein DnaC
MNETSTLLLRTYLKQLRLPVMAREYEKLGKEAGHSGQTYDRFLLNLVAMEVENRQANTLKRRIRSAGFPVHKDFDTFDFSALPTLNKQRVLELADGGWIEEKACLVALGNPGTGKTHLAIAWGLAACRNGYAVRFFTAAGLANTLEEARQEHRLEKMLKQLDKCDLLIIDELGYLSFTKTGAELLFQVFARRYERRSLIVTTNLAFADWGQVFQDERLAGALLDRLTHRCHIFEMKGESFRFRESMKTRGSATPHKRTEPVQKFEKP